jgi:hypothetical protein
MYNVKVMHVRRRMFHLRTYSIEWTSKEFGFGKGGCTLNVALVTSHEARIKPHSNRLKNDSSH